MNQVKQLFFALGKYKNAMSFISQNSMSWLFIFPVLFNIAFYIVGFYALSDLTDQAQSWMGLDQGNFPAWLEWCLSAIFWIVFFIGLALLSGFFVMLMLAPVTSYMAEKTANILEGKMKEQDLKTTLKNVIRGISLTLTNMFYEILFAFIFIIVGLIPLVGWAVAPIGMFLVSTYFFGFSHLDYMNERRDRNVKQSRIWVYKNKGLAVGSGIPFALVLMIPLIGTFIASMVILIATVAGTITMFEYENITTENQEIK